jgi:phage terminase large subunit GpA-like protein
MTALAPPPAPPPVIEPPLWTAPERDAWRVEPALKPSEWAEQYRHLPRSQSSREGPWRNAAAPYLRGCMDLAVARGVVELDIMKPPQVGVSEMLRNLLAYWSDREPDPCGLVLPGQEKGREVVTDRIIPMFCDTPRLKRLAPASKHDIKKGEIKLNNGFTLYLMWAGSASSTATHPCRRVICDEVDKYPECSGRESDAITLSAERMKTYEERRLQVNVSSPTTHYGLIAKKTEAASVKLYYHVPCPLCGAYQRMVFSGIKNLECPNPDSRIERADFVVTTPGAVWYECAACHGRIDESAKPAMSRAGVWRDLDGAIPDAEAVAEWPTGTRIAMFLEPFYCLWQSWSDIVARRIRAGDDPSALMDFSTQCLGVPYQIQAAANEIDFFAAKVARAATDEGQVPGWAAKVLVTVDTQHDHFWMVVRAWGPGMRSARVWHGRLDTFEEVGEVGLATAWRFEADAYPPLVAELLLIDSGGTRLAGERVSRTAQVYRWTMANPARVRAIKGSAIDQAGQHIRRGWGELDPGDKKSGLRVPVVHINVQHFHDVLNELQHRGLVKDDPRPEIWHLNRRDDMEYAHHLSSVHKVILGRGAGMTEVWQPKTEGARVDLDDCEVYQCAAALMAHVPMLPDQEDFDAMRAAAVADAKRAADAAQKPAPKRNPWEIRKW